MNDGLNIDSNGVKRWYLNGINISQEEYLKRTRNFKLDLLGL